MVSFGWSVGDIISACVLLTHIIKAFDDAKGTKKHYRDSQAFLSGLHQIVKYISDDEKAASLPEQAATQIQVINNAYSDFHSYVLKYANLKETDKSRLQTILPIIKWTMNELNDKVQKMKNNSLSAISIMETLIVVDLSARVNILISMGDRQEESLDKASAVLADINSQLSTLLQASANYRQLINDTSQGGMDVSADKKDLQKHLAIVSDSQAKLQEKLDKLVKHAEEKSQTDRHEAEQWRKLLEESQLAEQSRNQSEFQLAEEGLDRANVLIEGMGVVTGHSRISELVTAKLGGVRSILVALNPSDRRRSSQGFISDTSRDASSTATTTSKLLSWVPPKPPKLWPQTPLATPKIWPRAPSTPALPESVGPSGLVRCNMPPPIVPPPHRPSTVGPLNSHVFSTSSNESRPTNALSTFPLSSTLLSSPNTSNSSVSATRADTPMSSSTKSYASRGSSSSSPCFPPAIPPKPARLSYSSPTIAIPFVGELTLTVKRKNKTINLGQAQQ